MLFAGMFGTTFLLFFAVFYVYTALALMTIATKTNTPNGWLAWIPIANIILMLNIARKPIWWIVLFLIPHRDDHPCLDGRCRGAQQAQLVGNSDHRARGERNRARLSCLGGLAFADSRQHEFHCRFNCRIRRRDSSGYK
jgi:hypothetical protein